MKYYLYHAYEYSNKLNIYPVDEIKGFSKYKKVGGTEFKDWSNLKALDLNRQNLQSSFNHIQRAAG